MTQQDDKIYFGLFEKFDKPTVLFVGRSPAFGQFSDLLNSHTEKLGESVPFSEIPVFTKANIEIVLKIVPSATGMKRVDDGTFEWGLSAAECRRFAAELQKFASAQSDEAFHQYLDCEALDDVQVMASIGEYDPSIFNATLAA